MFLCGSYCLILTGCYIEAIRKCRLVLSIQWKKKTRQGKTCLLVAFREKDQRALLLAGEEVSEQLKKPSFGHESMRSIQLLFLGITQLTQVCHKPRGSTAWPVSIRSKLHYLTQVLLLPTHQIHSSGIAGHKYTSQRVCQDM